MNTCHMIGVRVKSLNWRQAIIRFVSAGKQ